MPPRPAADPTSKRRDRAFLLLRKRAGGENLDRVLA